MNLINTSVNKPNVAALVTILTPLILWAINRFGGTNLSEAETAMITAALGGVAAWIGVYFTSNRGE